MKLLFCLFLLLVRPAYAEPLNPKLLQALHQTETGGRYGAILGDHGRALGPFQIHKQCWLDSGLAGSYSQCSDYDYSVKVVTSYLIRYGKSFIVSSDFKSLARIWNGGPMGYRNKNTLNYAKKVIDNIK